MSYAIRIRLLGALLIASVLSPLAAQQASSEAVVQRKPRRAVLAVIGAVVGAAGGAFFHRQAGGDACRACYVAAGSAAGAVAGLLVGRELDQMYTLRYASAPRIRIPYLEQPLDGHPLTLTARDTLLAVATTTGVSLLSSTDVLRLRARRASGIRNIAAIDLAPRSHAIAVAAPTGLYVYPPGGEPGVLLREGTIQAATASHDRVFYSIGSRIEWAPTSATIEQQWPGIELAAPASHLHWDSPRSILWALSDTLLIALDLRGDSARIASRTRVDAGGRSLAAREDRIAIALGSEGVVIIESSDPVAPYELSRWSGARFVYDAAIAGDRLYAGAGPEGVYIVDITTVPFRTIGLAFDLGFAASLLSRDGYTYILDRRSGSVRRISTPTTR
jgi:hypothetical protein